MTVRILGRDIDFAGRNHPSGTEVNVMGEPASGGYFYAMVRHGISEYVLSIREADLVPLIKTSQEPTAELLLRRTDRLFNAAYNAYVEFQVTDGKSNYIAGVYMAYRAAWATMTGLCNESVQERLEETYNARKGERIFE